MKRIALATCRELPRLTPDDRLLLEALDRRGLGTSIVFWDAGDVRWERFDLVLIRSCWDYHLHGDAFLAWVAAVDRATTIWNPLPLVRWNVDKHYLRDLANAGVAVAPTRWPCREGPRTLDGIFRSTGWEEAVVKPTVSASAHRTWRVRRTEAQCREAELSRAMAQGDVMVQRYLPEITTGGEWSMIFLDGAFSHAALKSPKPGDFRVQPDFGGTVQQGNPGPELLAAGRRAVAAAPHPWHYARVDGVETDGGFMLMELELIEPALYFAQGPGSADRAADMITLGVDGQV